MIDLHAHTFFSDGELSPAELTERCARQGYESFVITDHADHSNYRENLVSLLRFCRSHHGRIPVIPGVELTYVPPEQIAALVAEIRTLGRILIVVHGETLVEPVPEGTNHAAIEAGVDILAHPGLISSADATLARKRNVCLEITTRKGHSLSNGHVAAAALRAGAPLVLNNDQHSVPDILSPEMAEKIVRGAGMTGKHFGSMQKNSRAIVNRYIP